MYSNAGGTSIVKLQVNDQGNFNTDVASGPCSGAGLSLTPAYSGMECPNPLILSAGHRVVTVEA